jgi:predicted metal-dependent peptidase
MPKKQTNVNDALISRQATQEEIDNFNIDVHLLALMWKEPFFSSVLRHVQKIKTEKIPTAGVSASGGDIRLWWNPNFLAGLTKEQICGLFKHECYHLIFEHTTTRKHEPFVVWNYATDLAINSLIDEVELPEGGLIPGKSFISLTAEQVAQMGEKAAERYNKVSAKIASFPKNKNSEWYFAELMKDPEIKEAIESSDKMGGKSLGQALADGDVKIDEDGNLVDKDGNPITIVPGTADDHDGWAEGMSEEERDLVKGKIKSALENAVIDCDNKGNWGSIGADMRKEIKKLVSKEIPWQSVLKQFCGMSRRADRTSSIRRLNRKYVGIHPGSYRDYKASIAVYLDQSGSVSDSDLTLLAGELSNLAKKVEFVLFNFDTSVDEASERTLKKGRPVNLERTRCGGTDFKCVQVHANKNASRFDGYLVLTDGYAPNPRGANRLKRGWVIVPNGELQFKKSNRDFLIQMKNEKDRSTRS